MTPAGPPPEVTETTEVADDDFDEVWNRACGFDSPALQSHPGDRALHVALAFHGRVMNGGLLDAVGDHDLDPQRPLADVLAAYTRLGLAPVAGVVERAWSEAVETARVRPGALGDVEERIDGSYTVDDGDLERAARAYRERSPEDFAPLP